jgi:hypothetical protein
MEINTTNKPISTPTHAVFASHRPSLAMGEAKQSHQIFDAEIATVSDFCTQKSETSQRRMRQIGFMSFFSIIFVTIILLTPHPALADPHAMFYTDKGQEQVFYNFLAAMNQADYVEAPPASIDPNATPVPPSSYAPTSPPNIDYNTRIGNFLATGKYYPRTDARTAVTNDDGSVTVGPAGTATALEPQERTNLPHITVRQVTSDNGDAFLRETLQRKALAEQMRVEFAALSCRLMVDLYGPNSITGANGSSTANGTDPCDQYVTGDDKITGGTQQ